MRVLVCAIVIAVVGCTADNPLFGHSGSGSVGAEGGTETTAGTGGGTSTSSTSSGVTGSASTSDLGVEVTTDPGATTLAPQPNCCDQNECDPTLEACLCELSPACCARPWAGNCIDIAIACGASCMDQPRPCCTPHPEPGCEGVIVEIPGFCQAHAECCLQAWKPACVAAYHAASQSCDLLPCDLPHSTPLCDDPDVLACLCPERPQCCDEAWDETCVEKAADCPM